MGKTLKLAVNSGHFFPFSWPGPGTFPVCLERSEQCCPEMLASAPRILSFPICQWLGRRGASSGSFCAFPLRLVVWATLKQQTGHEQVRTYHVLHLLSCLHKLTQTACLWRLEHDSRTFEESRLVCMLVLSNVCRSCFTHIVPTTKMWPVFT